MKKLLSLTGGATKFIQLVTAMIEVYKRGYVPTDLITISASSIAALPFVLGLHEEMVNEGTNLELSDIFKVSPVTEKGGIAAIGVLRALWSWLPGDKVHSVGVQDVTPLITKYITEELFFKYKFGAQYPNIHTISYDPTDDEVVVINLKDVDYETALAAIAASSHIPVFTQAVEVNINNTVKDLVDGGVYTSNAAGFLIRTGYFDADDVDTLVSVYAWEKNRKLKKSTTWKKNIFNNALRTSNGQTSGNMWYSEDHEMLTCNYYKIPRYALFLPNVIENLYEVDNKILRKARQETLISVNEQLDNYNF